MTDPIWSPELVSRSMHFSNAWDSETASSWMYETTRDMVQKKDQAAPGQAGVWPQAALQKHQGMTLAVCKTIISNRIFQVDNSTLYIFVQPAVNCKASKIVQYCCPCLRGIRLQVSKLLKPCSFLRKQQQSCPHHLDVPWSYTISQVLRNSTLYLYNSYNALFELLSFLNSCCFQFSLGSYCCSHWRNCCK